MPDTRELQARAGYFAKTRDLSRSLLYVLPLLAIYEIGVLVLMRGQDINGAGAILKMLIHVFGGPEVFNLVVIVLVAIAAVKTQRRGGMEPTYLVFVVIESVAWAFAMLVFAVLFTQLASVERAPDIATTLGSVGAPDRLRAALAGIVAASGAGVYEEIVFRLLLMMGLIWLFASLIGDSARHEDQKIAVLLGVLVSAGLFAAAHHIPPQPPMALQPMVFRLVCGFFFGVIFLLRGLAVAVYTHTLYDVYAMVIQPLLVPQS